MSQQYDELANVYARSLYELADAAGGLEKIGEVHEELNTVVELAGQPSFVSSWRPRSSVRPPSRRPPGDLRRSSRPVAGSSSSPTARGSDTSSRSRAFDAHVQEAQGRVEVGVITATADGASAELLEAVKSRIKSALGKEPVLRHSTDPSMIGGVKLQIGDELVDGSVATRLRRMKEEIIGNGATVVRSGAGRFLDDAS